MTIAYLYGGPPKRDIIDRAYGFCGQSASQFELSPEEYVEGLRALNDQMGLLGPSTGYNYPPYGDGLPEDESGLDQTDVLGAAGRTARLLAPQIGKQLSVSKTQQRAADVLLAKYQQTPQMSMGRHTIRGSGNRSIARGRPFFYTAVSPDEEPQ